MDQSGSLLSSAEQPGLDAVLCTPRLSLMNVRWSFSMLKIFCVRSSVHISEKDRRTGSTMESKCFLKVYMNLHVNLHFSLLRVKQVWSFLNLTFYIYLDFCKEN